MCCQNTQKYYRLLGGGVFCFATGGLKCTAAFWLVNFGTARRTDNFNVFLGLAINMQAFPHKSVLFQRIRHIKKCVDEI